MKRALILCTGNSCRSQMAEGLWRELGKGEWEVHSAGSNPAGYVHPLAIQSMREVGIDISNNRSKQVDEFRNQTFDVVLTVCDSAREACPVLPGAKKVLHWSIEDPAQVTGSEEHRLGAFRRIRNEISSKVRDYVSRGQETE